MLTYSAETQTLTKTDQQITSNKKDNGRIKVEYNFSR